MRSKCCQVSFFSHSLKGKHNKYLKEYAQATNNLVNKLTHDTSASMKDMLMAVMLLKVRNLLIQ